MTNVKDRGPGLAYTTRPDGRVRGTYDGRYVVLNLPHDPEALFQDTLVERLRKDFSAGYGQPIPATGLPPLD